MKAVLGRKLGMTQVFAEDGRLVPVTVIEAGPMVVTKLRTKKLMAMKLFRLLLEKLKKRELTNLLEDTLQKQE